ncbi:nicotianamine synthase family protein [Methanosarcina sp. Mfa9]|uniref:nicotianamine synthase family protein n=1 Tax=Methanosarcina sp. Mfa9 TaxID=3439063 RepID=UPI003F85B6F8
MNNMKNIEINGYSWPYVFSRPLQRQSQQLDSIRKQIIQFHEKIRGLDGGKMAALSSGQLFGLFSELDALGHLDLDEELCQYIFNDPKVHSLLPDIYSRYSNFFSLHERQLTEEILGCENPWGALETFSLYPRYESMIRDYVRSCPKVSTLAFLGCGPLPISLLLLGRLYGIHCIGIDSDPEAVAFATRCVKHFGLEDKIRIICGDESALSRLEWDSVMMAGLAWPKQRIFKNLHSMLKAREKKGLEKPASICYRDYTGMRQLLYWPVREEYLTGFKKTMSIQAERQVNNTLVFLECE